MREGQKAYYGEYAAELEKTLDKVLGGAGASNAVQKTGEELTIDFWGTETLCG